MVENLLWSLITLTTKKGIPTLAAAHLQRWALMLSAQLQYTIWIMTTQMGCLAFLSRKEELL